MKDNLQKRVQRYGWDRAAGDYEAGWQRPLQPAQDELLERADLHPGQHVLDVACGTGLVTFSAADAVAPGGEVVGTDLSDGMIKRAEAIAEERGIRNVMFERMDAEKLDLPHDTFDVVLCSLGLMYVPDPEEALREMHRVLAPGRQAVASVWGARTHCGWAAVFPIVDRRVESDVCPLFFQLGTGSALESAFRAAGFVSVTSNRLRTVLPFESQQEACRAVFEGGPVAMAWRTFDVSTREAARAEYREAVAPYANGRKVAIPGEFVITHGFKPSR